MHYYAAEAGPFHDSFVQHVPLTSSQTLPPPPCHPTGPGNQLFQEKPWRMGMGNAEGAFRQTLPPDPIRQQRSNIRNTGTARIPSTMQISSSVAAENPSFTALCESDFGPDRVMQARTQRAACSREPTQGQPIALPAAGISQAFADVDDVRMVAAVQNDTERVSNCASAVPVPNPAIDQFLPTTISSSVILFGNSSTHGNGENAIVGVEQSGPGAVLNPDDRHGSLQHVAVVERREMDLSNEHPALQQSEGSSVLSGCCTSSTPMSSKIPSSLSRQSSISSGPTSSSPPPYPQNLTPSLVGSPNLNGRHSQGPTVPVISSSLEDGEIVDDPGESMNELACRLLH